MPPKMKQVYAEALALPAAARADLAERIVVSLARKIDPAIERAQISEVRRRIAQVESGEVKLIPGEKALARARALLGSVPASH